MIQCILIATNLRNNNYCIAGRPLTFPLFFSIPPPRANDPPFSHIENGKTSSRAFVFLVSEFVVETSPSYSRSSVCTRIRGWILDY